MDDNKFLSFSKIKTILLVVILKKIFTVTGKGKLRNA